MIYEDDLDGYEVLGRVVKAAIEGARFVRGNVLFKVLSKIDSHEYILDNWYPLKDILMDLYNADKHLGPFTLKKIGKNIPLYASWPADINNLQEALESIDYAYHMNHRYHGEIMFDMRTGEMLEGIGHYTFKKIADNKFKIVADNLYPCDFDRGIIEAVASKFRPYDISLISITHDKGSCRKRGDKFCSYTVELC